MNNTYLIMKQIFDMVNDGDAKLVHLVTQMLDQRSNHFKQKVSPFWLLQLMYFAYIGGEIARQVLWDLEFQLKKQEKESDINHLILSVIMKNERQSNYMFMISAQINKVEDQKSLALLLNRIFFSWNCCKKQFIDASIIITQSPMSKQIKLKIKAIDENLSFQLTFKKIYDQQYIANISKFIYQRQNIANNEPVLSTLLFQYLLSNFDLFIKLQNYELVKIERSSRQMLLGKENYTRTTDQSTGLQIGEQDIDQREDPDIYYYQYSAVGLLVIFDKNTCSTATATLIAKNMILTCTHALYDSNGCLRQSFIFVAGCNNKRYSKKYQKIKLTQQCVRSSNISRLGSLQLGQELSIILLEDEINVDGGFPQMICHEKAEGKQIDIIGYGQCQVRYYEQTKVLERVYTQRTYLRGVYEFISAEYKTISYKLPTTKGMSGGPIFARYQKTDGTYDGGIIGIHCRGNANGVDSSAGLVFDREILTLVNGFILSLSNEQT